MRTLLTTGLLASLMFVTGCLGCSGYSGGGDQVYSRGDDSLILCENGGFIANVSGNVIDGFYTDNAAGDPIAVTGTEGDNGAHAFDLTDDADGTVTIPQFGATPFSLNSMNEVELDHANIQCTNLETETWWTAQ